MTDPLNPENLAQVPEVRDKFSALRRVINERRDGDYHGPDPRVGHDIAADQAYRARRTEAEQGVVDAVLSAERERMTRVVGGDLLDLTPYEQALLNGARDAERSRLLALTPEGVVEEVAKLIHAGQYNEKWEDNSIGFGEQDREWYRKVARELIPVLLAPEVAKREAAEKENEELRNGQRVLARFREQAEAERDRLKAALEEIRDLDYRGNRHQSASIAYAALGGAK